MPKLANKRPRDCDQRMRAWRGCDPARRAHEQRVVKRCAHLAQRHADRRLTHAERLRRATDAQLVVQREGDRQKIEIDFVQHGFLRDSYSKVK